MDFDEMLARGLGRAVLHLQSHDPAPHRDAILHACTHFLGYDRQLDSERDRYYFDIINATCEPEWYVPRLKERFVANEDVELTTQLFALLALFAAQGDTEARALLYKSFPEIVTKQDYVLREAEALIALDGLPAYVFVVQQWLQHPPAEDDYWYEANLFEHVEERYGEETVAAILTAHALGDYLARTRELRQQWKERNSNRPRPVSPDYDVMQQFISVPGRKHVRSPLWRAGRYADDALMLNLAEELLAENDLDRLLKYLVLFERRPFPLDPQRIIALTRHDDKDIAKAARRVLAHVTHSAVRELALSLIAKGETGHNVEMLEANPAPTEDYALFATLTATVTDKDEFHFLGVDIRNYFKAHPSAVAASALLNLYEFGYCTMCRHGVVKALLSLNALPPALADECRFDADEDTRKLVSTPADPEQV